MREIKSPRQMAKEASAGSARRDPGLSREAPKDRGAQYVPFGPAGVVLQDREGFDAFAEWMAHVDAGRIG